MTCSDPRGPANSPGTIADYLRRILQGEGRLPIIIGVDPPPA